MSANPLSGKKPVQVHVVTDIRDGHRKETASLHAEGMYYEKDEAVYLTYKEKQEDGDIQTIVKIGEQEVRITRTGAVKMRQVFRKKVKLDGTYISPYGQMQMTTLAHNIEYKRLKTKGKLFLTYDLHLHGQHAGKYALTITFKEEQ